MSKNDALLLDVGPVADGAIPSLQRQRLPSLGAWLRVNEEGVFDSRLTIEARCR